MTRYNYKAKQGPQKVVDGYIEADSMDQAIRGVIQKGFVPIDVTLADDTNRARPKEKAVKKSMSFIKQIRLNDLVLFTRQMSDLIDASVPVPRALQIIINQTKNDRLKEIVSEIYEHVRDGKSLSESLSYHREVFSNLYINMVGTGEVGGQLPHVLERLANYLEKDLDTKNKVRSSLAYPTFILIVGAVTLFVLFTFVIPRLTVMFDDFDQQLPLMTRVLMSISTFFVNYWWLILIVIVIFALYFRRLLQSPQGRLWFDNFKLRIPVLGEFFKTVEVGRFSRTLGTLIESNIVITQALQAVNQTVENTALKNEIKNISADVANGVTLKNALQKCSLFPEMAVNMISVGEETGRLEKGLYKIADTFERQSEQSVKTLLSLLGPMVLVVIVAVVGFVVIAMLMPILQLNMIVQ